MIRRFVVPIALIMLLAGCISSDHPLVSKDSSVALIGEATYCVVKVGTDLVDLSQCAFEQVIMTPDVGYTFTLVADKPGLFLDEFVKSAVPIGENRHVRIHEITIENRAFKALQWHIMQYCKTATSCMYLAIAT